METWSLQQEKNWQAALQISRETRANPDSIYQGKYVAVAREKVVATADNLIQLYEHLERCDESTQDFVVVEASLDYERTYMIW